MKQHMRMFTANDLEKPLRPLLIFVYIESKLSTSRQETRFARKRDWVRYFAKIRCETFNAQTDGVKRIGVRSNRTEHISMCIEYMNIFIHGSCSFFHRFPDVEVGSLRMGARLRPGPCRAGVVCERRPRRRGDTQSEQASDDDIDSEWWRKLWESGRCRRRRPTRESRRGGVQGG